MLWLEKLKAHAQVGLQHDKITLGKLAAKSKDFVEYVRKAQKRLGLDEQLLSTEDITHCFEACLAKLGVYRRLTALRSLLARTVESLVLVDRLCFLLSLPDVKTAALMPLFDATISPRSFAMIAVR